MRKQNVFRCFLYFAACWALLCAFPLWGNSTPGQESLLIGPGDMLHVVVLDTPDLEEHARVTDTGFLALTLGGNAKVTGLTPEEAAHVIEKVLVDGNYVLHPRVLVTIEEYATQKVSVLGEVKVPGAISIHTPRSVLDVLTLAGGLTENADRKILITRHGSLERVSYFVSNQGGAAADNLIVNPGDSIFVPKAGIVYVLGDVNRPGGYMMTNNEAQLTVLQLVARAGGTRNSAVPSHTKLVRNLGNNYVESQIPLSDMQKGKLADMPLVAGDIIYVPFSYLRNFGLQATGVVAAAASAAVYHF